MKILIFSNYNVFTLSLLSRLHKEGYSNFVVTGNKRKTSINPGTVFQEYNFPYNSKSIPYIIENIEPDIIIIGKELDYNSDFLPGITNIIYNLKNANIKQLIYLSSLCVFSGNVESIIDEGTLPKPTNEREKALLMGEKIAIDYDRDRKFKVSILRFGQLYGTYNNKYMENNIVAKMCKKILLNEEIEVFENKRHMLLYVDDAVDVVYKIVSKDQEQDQIYHVGPELIKAYTEQEIISVFRAILKPRAHVKIIENKEEIHNKIYRTDKLKQLKFQQKHKIKDKTKELYNAIKKSQGNKEKAESQGISLLNRIIKIDSRIKNKLIPYIENLIFFVILNIFIYATRSMGFHETIDFYLLYVIIIGIIYGYEQPIFTLVLTVIARRYMSEAIGVRVLNFTSYPMYMWILQLFTVGVLVGYLKEQYQIKYLNIQDEKDYLALQLSDVKEINESNKAIKDLYEGRLLNYKNSLGRIYEIVSELDDVEPQGIIFKSIGVIRKIMGTNDVSIYIYGGNSGFYRLMASSTEKAKTLKNSLNISDHSSLFDKLRNKQMYINTTLDSNYPIMAEGIYKGDQLESIMMIWSLPFESNNLYQMNVFAVACKLIENSLNTAYAYMENIRTTSNLFFENVLDERSFKKVLKIYQYGADEGIVSYHVLKIKLNTQRPLEECDLKVRESLRETDYIARYEDGDIRVLLTNTNKEESELVVKRLRKSGICVEEGECYYE